MIAAKFCVCFYQWEWLFRFTTLATNYVCFNCKQTHRTSNMLNEFLWKNAISPRQFHTAIVLIYVWVCRRIGSFDDFDIIFWKNISFKGWWWEKVKLGVNSTENEVCILTIMTLLTTWKINLFIFNGFGNSSNDTIAFGVSAFFIPQWSKRILSHTFQRTELLC